MSTRSDGGRRLVSPQHQQVDTRPIEADPQRDVRRARHAPGLLREFNDAGVLGVADVHVALRLAELGGESDAAVILAAALAARAPRLGHVCVDLTTIRETATVDSELSQDLSALAWPQPAAWVSRVGASALVGADGDDASVRPLRLAAGLLYLDRYWREEQAVAADVRRLAEGETAEVDRAVLAAGLARLFAGQTDSRQCLAAGAAVLRRFCVVAGGPGTGKTTTVARIVALLYEQASAAGRPEPLVALAAPTAVAAARLEEAVHDEAVSLPVDPALGDRLAGLSASTLHRLLGWRPDSHSRFRHHRANRLPHDVVVVDETSMVSLSLMGRLLEAVRPQARLIVIGDPGQLTSIEAGAVLGDVVGPAADGLVMSADMRSRLAQATGRAVEAADPPPGCAGVGDGIVVLDRVHRYGGAIARVAESIRAADADGVMAALDAGGEGVTWIVADIAEPGAEAALAPVRDEAVRSAHAVIDAARAGHAPEALDALAGFRVLCAHRRGDHGVTTWMARIERWLAQEIDGFAAEGEWYAGRPLLVTENDYALRLYNGDTGVVVAGADGRPTAAFERRGEIVEIRPSRLSAVDTVYAMTVHKSQGSQFDTAAVLLPPPDSRILTRELLYTAVTRARERLVLVGTQDAVRAAVERPIARASGLMGRLWEGGERL
ncbi:MAG: exodeoxyribonuclease V subunit alpha [Solirubrobacteraceae bacterium MAG38_C4-C5]|nr:exodeoxyribonuclease V subunit alpha [Candidatus Siliceabacter maunaloa]